jgi:hypothetical protein
MPKINKLDGADFGYELFLNVRKQVLLNLHFFNQYIEVYQSYYNFLAGSMQHYAKPDTKQSTKIAFQAKVVRFIRDFFRLFILVKDEYYFCNFGVAMAPFHLSRGKDYIIEPDSVYSRPSYITIDNGAAQKPRVLCSVIGLLGMKDVMVEVNFKS